VQDIVREVAEEELARNLQADLSDPVHRDSPIDVVRDAFEFGAYRNLDLVRRGIVAGGSTVFHPTEIPELVQDAIRLAASIRRQLLVVEPARSKLFAPGSLARRYDLLNVSFDRARSVASACDVSINDVFVAAVTGGIGLYHERMGAPVDELRMAMAISTREGSADTAANRFTPTRVLVPVGPKDPAARLRGVRERIGTLRNEPALAAADSLAGLVSGLPTSLLVGLMRSQTRTIDFATSNLRGSPIELFVGGARIDATYPMGPRTGCALNVTMISYCGELGLGIHSDPAAVTDPDGLVDCLRESFDALLELAG
jgi:hypothetical protein